MNPVYTLLRKEITSFLRHRSAIVITFLVPIVLIYLFGWVFGLNKTDSTPSGIPLLIVNQCQEPAATTLIDALRAEKTFKVVTEVGPKKGPLHLLTEVEVRELLHNNKERFALIIPEDFTSDKQLGLHLVYLNNPRNEIEAMMVNGMLQKTLFFNMRDLLSQSLSSNARRMLGAEKFEAYNRGLANLLSSNFGGDRDALFAQFQKGDYLNMQTVGNSKAPAGTTPAVPALADPKLRRLDSDTAAQPAASPLGASEPTPAPLNESALPNLSQPTPASPAKTSTEDFLSRLLRIDSEQVAGKDVKNPAAARLVGGYAIMFLLFAVSGFSTSFFEEKRSGIYQRLLASNARRHHILWAKYLFCILLGLGQLTALLLFGHFLYDLQLFDHLLPLFVIALCSAAACASFGMLIASIATNPQAANGLATMLIITMSAVGGAWFPISFMPAFIQNFAKLTVVYWSVEGFTNILWAGEGLLRSLPHAGVLLLMAGICQAIALWRFRKGNLFE